MTKYLIAYSNNIIIVCYWFGILFLHSTLAQEQMPNQSDSLSGKNNSHQNNFDPRYSVFGPPQPAYWKFQLSHTNSDNEGASSFNFYRKDQRD